MLARLKSRIGRPGVRAAADNLAWLVMDRFARFFVGVFVGLLVARYLGPERFGALSYALSVTGILLVLIEGGLDAVVKRELLLRPEASGRIIMAAARMRAVAVVGTYACLLAAVLSGLLGGQHRSLLLIVGGLFLQPILMLPDLWFQVRLDARASVRAQSVALVFGAAVRLALVLGDAPLLMFGWITLSEGLLAGVMLVARARIAGFRLDWGARCSDETRRLWHSAWPLLLSGLSVSIYMRVDAVMLNHLAGEAAVGVYAAATRLSEVWYFLPTALGSSVLPGLLRARTGDPAVYHKKLQMYFDLSAGGAYLLAIPVTLLAYPVVRMLYGDAYTEAGAILAVHIWAGVFVFLGVARGQCLVNDGRTRFYALSTLAGALVNVGLNWLLIPRFQGVGAAWATLLSYACAAWVSSFFHPAVRPLALLQANALLIPFRFWSYFRRK